MGAPTRHPATTGDGSAGLPRVPVTFTPTPRVRQLLAGLPTIAVLRAPRGFGKSSAVARWLRRADLPDHDVVWVTLPGPMDATSFWDCVGDGLVRAGFLDPGASPDGWAMLARDARDRRRHLVLVVDGLDRVRDRTLDEELVGLAQRHDGLDLVLLMREHRPVVVLARAALEAAVVLRADLALGPEEVAGLARAMGVDLAPGEAERLGRDLGGWPGLIRIALLTAARTARGALLLDAASLADYLRVILHDAELAEVRLGLLTLAVPAELTPDVLTLVLGAEADDVIARARAGGLMPEGDGPPAYPTELRSLLLQILREDAPERLRALHRTLAGHHSRTGRPLAALHHASSAHEPAMVMDVLERWWTELLEHPAAVRAALEGVPAGLLDGTAKARVARDHLLPTIVSGSLLVAASAVQPAWPDPRARTAGSAGSPAAAPDEEEVAVLLGLGTARLLAGEPLEAAHAFTDALAGAGRGGVDAGGGLALSLALLGHLDAARRHLPARDEGQEDPGLPGGLGAAGAALVPALIDLDRLTDAAGPVPDGTLDGLEPLAVYVRAGRCLHAGDALAVVGEVARFQRAPEGRTGLARSLLTATLVDLYLSLDQVDHARRLVEPGLPGEGPWLRAARTRVALALGDLDTVLDLTVDAAEQATVRPRTSLDLALARTVAAHRLGRYRAASEALDLAVAVVETSGILRRLLLVPRSDLEQVARTVPHAAALLARPELSTRAEQPPGLAARASLSPSERRVLTELATGRQISQVARRLFVSESTVKTQVRSIYRKLEVHSRAEALARARALGILGPE